MRQEVKERLKSWQHLQEQLLAARCRPRSRCCRLSPPRLACSRLLAGGGAPAAAAGPAASGAAAAAAEKVEEKVEEEEDEVRVVVGVGQQQRTRAQQGWMLRSCMLQ
mgnify:CR=1 FL=1